MKRGITTSSRDQSLATFQQHGGRLTDAATAFARAPRPWVDLSTGVNPHPWRGGAARVTGDLARLPDPATRTRLEAVAAVSFGTQVRCVAAVPGADAGLRLLPHLTKAGRVAIVSPTYGGHAEVWTAAGTRVIRIRSAALDDVDADAVVMVNPNNPDGTIAARKFLIRLAARLAARGRWLIVDESFVELRPELSMASRLGKRTIVLRSFGKFYGLPGVRLGFVVAHPDVIVQLRPRLGDWPISAQAIAVGSAAYADLAWQNRMRERLDREARRLDRLLTRSGFRIVGGTALFRLASRPDAAAVFRFLGQAGILVRPFAEQPEWLRFGLPPRSAWSRLHAALEHLP